MDSSPLLKKPKLEHEQIINGDNSGDASRAVKPNGCDASGGGGNDDDTLPDQEEALVVLSEHQTKECNIIRKKVAHYKTQLEEAEKRLGETQAKLARIRHRSKASPPPAVAVKVEDKQSSPSCSNQERSQIRSTTVQQSSRPQLLIPPHNAKSPMPADARGGREPKPELKANSGAGIEKAKSFPDKGAPAEAQEKRIKRKLEQKEHRDLIPKIRTSSSPCIIKFQSGILISSHHKRKLRSLELCPVNDHLFVTRFFFMIQKGANFAYSKADSNCFSDIAFPIGVPDLVRQIMAKALLGVCIDHQTILILISTADFFTSALDGVVNLWQVQGKGSNASLLSSVDCLSPKQRRWPEDIAWHPDGDSIFAAYTADGGDSQISILNLNASREKKVSFLDRKPHHKGIINSIMFMPWRDICFTTGGSDHTVILWQEADDSWKSKTIHGNLHSSAVMGVAGLYQKKTILSVGADKRIIAFDLSAGRSEFKNQIESKCMSVLPNPSDFNLYMVQTGEPGKQLRLFDVRLRQTEIHAFGWKQETSESQSALINQAWSPDGLYASSGSADPVIHIFDIRCDGRKPSQSVQAHQKRVFKAVWHQSLPLLTSISSDLNIGLHRTL